MRYVHMKIQTSAFLEKRRSQPIQGLAFINQQAAGLEILWTWDPESQAGMARTVTKCLDKSCERTAREGPWRKVEEGMEGSGTGEKGWGKEMEKTYQRFLCQKATPPPIRRRDARTTVMIKPTGTWLPSASGTRGCLSPDSSLAQAAWSKHRWGCQVLISSPI